MRTNQLLYNKKASFNYDITETFEAGIELLGFEVRALREKRGSLEGAYVGVRGGEAYIIGMHIPPYQAKNTPENYDPDRARRLLLHKKELDILLGAEAQKGLTIVPISVYNTHRLLKVSLGIGRGKKAHDKRETLKKRDADREINRTIKHG